MMKNDVFASKPTEIKVNILKIQAMIRAYLAWKHLKNIKSSLPVIENLTPLVHPQKSKPDSSKLKSEILSHIRNDWPSSAGSQSKDPTKIKEMLKYLKNKSGTTEKKSDSQGKSSEIKNELQINLDERFETEEDLSARIKREKQHINSNTFNIKEEILIDK